MGGFLCVRPFGLFSVLSVYVAAFCPFLLPPPFSGPHFLSFAVGLRIVRTHQRERKWQKFMSFNAPMIASPLPILRPKCMQNDFLRGTREEDGKSFLAMHFCSEESQPQCGRCSRISFQAAIWPLLLVWVIRAAVGRAQQLIVSQEHVCPLRVHAALAQRLQTPHVCHVLAAEEITSYCGS